MERIISKSRVLDSRSCAAAASERSTWARVHVKGSAKDCALRVLVTVPQDLQARMSMYELLPDLLKTFATSSALGSEACAG